VRTLLASFTILVVGCGGPGKTPSTPTPTPTLGDAGVSSGNGDSSGGDMAVGATTTSVQLSNASARLTRQYQCAPANDSNKINCGDYDVTFVMVEPGNRRQVQRITDFRFTIGGVTSRARLAGCEAAPWRLGTLGHGSIIDLYLTYQVAGGFGGQGTGPVVKYPCGENSTSLTLNYDSDLLDPLLPAAPPAGGTLRLEIDGLLDDATPFAASSDATVL
jgi:hypothetical protein